MKFKKEEERGKRKCVLLWLTGASLLLGLILLIVGSVMISVYNVHLDFITGSYKESAVGILDNFITGSYTQSAVGILVLGVIVICTSSLGCYAALKFSFDSMDLFITSFMFIAIGCITWSNTERAFGVMAVSGICISSLGLYSALKFSFDSMDLFITSFMFIAIGCITWSNTERAFGIMVMAVSGICISSLGLYSALKSHFDTRDLFFYSFMFIAIIWDLIASETIQQTKKRSDLGMQRNLSKSIIMYGSDSYQTDVWDLIQTELECCGLAGVEDYANSTFLSQTGQLPRSCCGPLQIHLFGQIEPCRGETASRYQTGCLKALKSYVRNKKDVVFGVMVLVEAIMQASIAVGATVLINMKVWAIVHWPRSQRWKLRIQRWKLRISNLFRLLRGLNQELADDTV